MAGPLSHVRVLDLSRIMAGPWAGQVLADLGADVIKVERPGAGDDTRAWGPPFLKDPSGKPTRGGRLLSRGQSRQALDHARPRQARRPGDRARHWRQRSDIVLENFKVGTLEALRARLREPRRRSIRKTHLLLDHRLRPDRAEARRSRLRLHDPGHGRPDERHRRARRHAGRRAAEGRRADRRPHDRHVRGGRGARGAGAPQRDRARATTSTSRCSTCRSAFLANQAMNYLVSGKLPQAQRQRASQHPAAGRFRCARRLHGAGGRQRRPVRQAVPRCSAMPNGSRDERFATNPQRVRNIRRSIALLRAEFAERKRAELAAALEAAGVPCGADQHRAGGLCRAAGPAPRHAARAAASRPAAACRRWSARCDFANAPLGLRARAAAARPAHR